MKKRIISVLIIVSIVIAMLAHASCHVKANGIIPDEENDIHRMKCTAYTSYSENAVCASGVKPHYGVCAGADKYLYDSEYFDEDVQGTWCALVWTVDEYGNADEFLGYFEIVDRGGTDAIRYNETVIDIYYETYDECMEFMKKTNGKCLVKYVKAVG